MWFALPLLAQRAHASARIELSSNAVVNALTVRLDDIASIEGADTSTVDRLKQIDLTTLDAVGDSATISQSLLTVRLALAGFDDPDFELVGAKKVVVTRRPTQTTDQAAIAELRKELAKVWQSQPEDVLITLVRPLPLDVLELAQDNHDIKPLMVSTPRLGANVIKFGAYRRGSLQTTFSASVEIRLIKELAIAVQTIPPGQVITEADVEVRRQPFRHRDALHASPNVVGFEAARVLQPGDMIAPTFVRRPRADRQTSPLVIKRRDRVKVVAVKGGLTVTIPQAEALDDGAVGDTIRLRNLQSRKIVIGQVEDSQTVKIKL